MPDYKKMYMTLIDGIEKALACTMATDNPFVAFHLKTALEAAEEVYINTCDNGE